MRKRGRYHSAPRYHLRGMRIMKRPLPRLFLFLCTPVLVAAATCPLFFSFNGGHCIHISTDNKTYCEAQTFCHSIGGELATGGWITQLPPSLIMNSYWIGASDLLDDTSSFPISKRKTSFRWTDGSFAQDKFHSEFSDFRSSAECKRGQYHIAN